MEAFYSLSTLFRKAIIFGYINTIRGFIHGFIIKNCQKY